jgi:hypothetical protein
MLSIFSIISILSFAIAVRLQYRRIKTCLSDIPIAHKIPYIPNPTSSFSNTPTTPDTARSNIAQYLFISTILASTPNSQTRTRSLPQTKIKRMNCPGAISLPVVCNYGVTSRCWIVEDKPFRMRKIISWV